MAPTNKPMGVMYNPRTQRNEYVWLGGDNQITRTNGITWNPDTNKMEY